MWNERGHRGARRMSEEESKPTPGSRDGDDDDDDLGGGPGGEPPSSSRQTKRKKATSRRTKEKPTRSDGAGESSAPAPAAGAMDGLSMTDEAVNRPAEVPVPEDVEDGDFVVDDVLITEGDNLPAGWIIVDDHMVGRCMGRTEPTQE